MMPLTQQEERVRALLIEKSLSHEFHHVFDLKGTARISVDFLVFIGPGLIIECTYCSKRKGFALAELRRRCAYIDYRFGCIKGSFPNLSCGVLVEAPKENQAQLATGLNPILKNSDFLARSIDELLNSLT